MFQKILVAIDQSPLGEHVFHRSLLLAQALQAELRLLHVLSSDEEGSPQLTVPATIGMPSVALDLTTLEIYQQQWQRYEQTGLSLLRSQAKTAATAGVPVEIIQLVGHPGRIICSTAADWGAELIVLGRRGRSGLSEFFLGSVSNYVLHHAPCEVLVVHTPLEPVEPQKIDAG